jgi:hypothetical protein
VTVARAFTAPRLDRADPVVSVAQALTGNVGSLPTAKPWSFLIEAGIGLRTTVVSPPFGGPGMVLEIMYRQAGSGTNFGGFGLLWSNEDGDGNTNGPLTPLPRGTRIFHPASIRAGGATDLDELPEHIIEIAAGTDPNAPVVIRPRFVVNTTDRWFLKATVRGPLAAGALHIRGVVTVVEASSLEELRNFY